MWINVLLLDCDDMTVKPLLTAQRGRLDYDPYTEYTLASSLLFFISNIHSAPRVSGLEMSRAFYPETFYLLLLRFWALRMVSSTRARRTYSQAESPEIVKLGSEESVSMGILSCYVEVHIYERLLQDTHF